MAEKHTLNGFYTLITYFLRIREDLLVYAVHDFPVPNFIKA